MVTINDRENPPSVQINEFLPPVSPWTTLGGLTLVVVFTGAIALVSLVKYPVTVKAQATIRPTGELRLVQAATEGRITRLFVRENQQVKSGDILATLDDSRLQTQKSLLQNQHQEVNLQLIQVKAQIQALDSEKTAVTALINRSAAIAQAELSRHQRQYRDNQLAAMANVQEAQANLRAAENESQRTQLELIAAQANLRSIEVALNVAQSKRDRYQRVAQDGAFPQEQLEEAQLAVEQQKQALLVQRAMVEAQKKIRATRQQEVSSSMARLQLAQIALNPSRAEMTIATERIAQETATGRATIATLNREREELIQRQIELQQQLERDSRSLKQVEQELRETTITATAGGTIVRLNLHNPGQTVRSGDTLAQIVPSHVPWVVKATVSSQDIGRLKLGQTTQMRVSACPYSDYGTLPGTVSKISQDTIIPSSPAHQTPAFYEVTIKPDRLVLGKDAHTCTLRLGMEGRADIITEKQTILQFLRHTLL